jgi:type II secretory pathway pseudopilin PulG
MWKLIKLLTLKKHQNPSQSGYITLEIIVSIIIALAFVLASMQTLAVAMMIKVQAQKEQRANQLILADIEVLKQQAASLPQAANHNTVCSATIYADGYAQDVWDAFTGLVTYQTNPTIKLLSDTSANYSTSTQLSLQRTNVTATSTAPHGTVKVKYQVKEWDGSTWGSEVIAENYVEVIPNVALQCP